MRDLDSEVADSSKDTQRIQPKIKKISSTERLVKSEQPSGSLTQENEQGVLFGREGTKTQQERRDLWMDHNPSRVVCHCLLNL